MTAAIQQDGANRVNTVIRSTSEREAAIEFAKAGAMRPRIVGARWPKISRDGGKVAGARTFDVLSRRSRCCRAPS